MPEKRPPQPVLKLAILKALPQPPYCAHAGGEVAAPHCSLFAAVKDAAMLITSLVCTHGLRSPCRAAQPNAS